MGWGSDDLVILVVIDHRWEPRIENGIGLVKVKKKQTKYKHLFKKETHCCKKTWRELPFLSLNDDHVSLGSSPPMNPAGFMNQVLILSS